MTAGAASVAIETEAPVGLADSDRFRILTYLSVLIMLMGFGAPFGGLIDVPISFFLKNKLHLQAHEVATFRLVSSIPLYLSIAFGFLRDSWSSFGIRDRGYMILFGAISAIVYVYFAFSDATYTMLLAAVFLLTTAFLFVASAQAGLTSAIGQQHVMSGQVSTIWNIFQAVPVLAAYFAGGFLSDALEGRNANEAARILFLVGAATGCRFSATDTPMSQAQDSLVCLPLSITSSPACSAPSGTRAMTKESEPMTMGAPTSPIMTRGRSDFANPFPRISELAAGDGSVRRHLRNLGPACG